MPKETEGRRSDAVDPDGGRDQDAAPSKDEPVDLASEMSFPASDPPPFWARDAGDERDADAR